jgi:hypothetical protein
MRFILIWWVIHPHHMQVIHREVYPTQAACEIAGGSVPAHNAAVRWRCSRE